MGYLFSSCSKLIFCCKYLSAYHFLYGLPLIHQSKIASAISSSDPCPASTPPDAGLFENPIIVVSDPCWIDKFSRLDIPSYFLDFPIDLVLCVWGGGVEIYRLASLNCLLRSGIQMFFLYGLPLCIFVLCNTPSHTNFLDCLNPISLDVWETFDFHTFILRLRHWAEYAANAFISLVIEVAVWCFDDVVKEVPNILFSPIKDR